MARLPSTTARPISSSTRATRRSLGRREKAEQWQILTPVRQNQTGVLALNRAIQQQFRKRFLDLAVRSGSQKRIITSPAGPESIIYGDKVINIVNSSRRGVYPDKDDRYVANGDIGVVTRAPAHEEERLEAGGG